MNSRLFFLMVGCLLVFSAAGVSPCFANADAEMECCKTCNHATVSVPFERCCGGVGEISNAPFVPELSASFHLLHTSTHFVTARTVSFVPAKPLRVFEEAVNTHWGGFSKQPFYIQNANLLL